MHGLQINCKKRKFKVENLRVMVRLFNYIENPKIYGNMFWIFNVHFLALYKFYL
jgi:hypothetical protein